MYPSNSSSLGLLISLMNWHKRLKKNSWKFLLWHLNVVKPLKIIEFNTQLLFIEGNHLIWYYKLIHIEKGDRHSESLKDRVKYFYGEHKNEIMVLNCLMTIQSTSQCCFVNTFCCSFWAMIHLNFKLGHYTFDRNFFSRK